MRLYYILLRRPCPHGRLFYAVNWREDTISETSLFCL